jgi:hypothetical protein
MAFAAAWRAPFGGPSHAAGLDGIQLLLWFWATGPMVASSFGLTEGNGLLVTIILWAFLIGTIGGFVIPKIIERDRGKRFVDVDVPPDKWKGNSECHARGWLRHSREVSDLFGRDRSVEFREDCWPGKNHRRCQLPAFARTRSIR